MLTQITVHVPPVQPFVPLKQRPFSTVPPGKALKLPEVVEAIRAECDATPPPCSQWTIDVHDKLLSKSSTVDGPPCHTHTEVTTQTLGHSRDFEAIGGTCGNSPNVSCHCSRSVFGPPPRGVCRVGCLSPFASSSFAPVSSPALPPSLCLAPASSSSLTPSPCHFHCFASANTLVASVSLADQVFAAHCQLYAYTL